MDLDELPTRTLEALTNMARLLQMQYLKEQHHEAARNCFIKELQIREVLSSRKRDLPRSNWLRYGF